MKYKILYIFTFLLISSLGFSQQKTVTGFVKDITNGEGMTGALVLNVKTQQATNADFDGAFSISASVNDTLRFTYLGKRPVSFVVDQRNVIEINMYDDETMLEEVTVVAFGTQKKSSVVSSIATVKVSDLRVPGSNLTSSIAGRIPGLISYSTSGEPGRDNAQFFIRGVTTMGFKVDPLYLIDGFEATQDDLARLQIDDIESFSVLKDAPATVLYGSRAANGIIIVTTKKGDEGKVRVNVRIDSHIATPTKIPKLADGIDYMNMYNEARMTRDPLLGAYYDEQKIQSTRDGTNPSIFPNVNWYDEIFRDYTINSKANINVSGGGSVAKYYVSGGYDHDTGLLKVDPLNNYNSNININRVHLRSNVTFKLSPTTTLETQLSSRIERQTGPAVSTDDIFMHVMNSNPVDFPAVYEPDEATKYAYWTLFGNTYVGGGMKVNPYAEMTRGYQDRNENVTVVQGTLTQDLGMITKGLKAELKASVRNWSKYTSTRMYNPFFYDLESYNQITGEHKLWCLNPIGGSTFLGDVMPGRDADFKYYYEARANWVRSFDRHSLAVMAVGMMEESLLTGGQSTSIYETLPAKNSGVSGRLSYDYDLRYFVELAFGYNGSEKFDKFKRFGFFPSAAVGWMVSNEDFWEPMKDVFSHFKLKYSIGKIGNDDIAGRSGRFFYLSDIRTFGATEAWGSGYRWGESLFNSFGGFTINRYANPNITWEISYKQNAGLEAYFLKDRLKIQADHFWEKRTHIYMTRENFPSTAGLVAAEPIKGNVGELKAWGYDGSVNYLQTVNRDFWIEGMFNFTYVDNKLTQLDEKDYADTYLKRLGYNVDQQWGLIAERLFVDEAEIFNSPQQDWRGYMAGDIKYKDINGDGVVNDNDRVPLGYPTKPKIQYGFGTSAGYKNVDFSFFFNGISKVSFFINPGYGGGNDGLEGIAPFVNRRNALEIVAKDYWSETNPNIYAFWPRLSTEPITNNMQQSTWWLRSGAFLRLQKIDAGYNIRNVNRFGVSGLRLYGTVENLFVLSSFKLWDVELKRRGLGYPLNKRFSLGVQINF